MISLKTIRKFRCPFGICIILSIVLVFTCDFLCDLGVISFQSSESLPISETVDHHHEHGDKHSSAGHHDHHKSDEHKSAEHHHESPDKGGCCDDYTRQFYSSLVSTSGTYVSVVHSEFYKLISTLTFVDLINITLHGTLPCNSKFEHRPNGPPGISGRIIRVFINSFLI